MAKLKQVELGKSWKHLQGTFAVWRILTTNSGVSPSSIVHWAFWTLLCGYDSDVE